MSLRGGGQHNGMHRVYVCAGVWHAPLFVRRSDAGSLPPGPGPRAPTRDASCSFVCQEFHLPANAHHLHPVDVLGVVAHGMCGGGAATTDTSLKSGVRSCQLLPALSPGVANTHAHPVGRVGGCPLEHAKARAPCRCSQHTCLCLSAFRVAWAQDMPTPLSEPPRSSRWDCARGTHVDWAPVTLHCCATLRRLARAHFEVTMHTGSANSRDASV